MAAPETNFDGVANQFGEYGEQVRGFVRYALVQRNLRPHLEGSPQNIVDVGGGAAIDAAWIATLGHEVTIVEPSAEQIEKGKKRLAVLPTDVQNRVTFVHGVTQDVLGDAGAGKYDMVLSHGVAMYVENPKNFIGELMSLIKAGGRISLLEKGYFGQEARLIRQGKTEELVALRATKKVINNMERTVHAFYPDDLRRMIVGAGGRIIDWTGVRLITDDDTRRVDSLEPRELEAIIEAEHSQGKNPGIRAQGQMLHFLAGKND